MGQGALIDSDEEETLLDLDAQSTRLFSDFMLRTAKFEELVKAGYPLLVGFYQELVQFAHVLISSAEPGGDALCFTIQMWNKIANRDVHFHHETFRRPQLINKSDVVDEIIKRFDTKGMKEYIEAGSIPPHDASQNIIKLHSYKQGLLDHLKQVSVLIEELEHFKEDVIAIAWQVNQNALDLLDKSFGDVTQLSSEEEVPGLRDKPVLNGTITSAVFRMLKPDFDMQEIIIKSLDLNTPSSELETYCQMWDLRPYIDENIMNRAWELV